MTEQQEKAMRMALESLEELVADPECDFGPSYALQQDRQEKAITALKAALKQPPCKTGSQCTNKCQRCEQPAPVPEAHKQEPVAWRWKYKFRDIGETGAYEYHSHEFACLNHMPKGEPLYTRPPAREWVGLTDEEIWNVLQFRGYNSNTIEIASAIEAKMREKNGGAA